MGIDTPQHLPPLSCSQSEQQRPRPQGRSCSCQGPQEKLDAATARVRLWLEPTLECQRPLTSLRPHSLSTLILVHSLEDNNLTNEAKQALQDAAGSSARINF